MEDDIQIRCCSLIIQICVAGDIQILKGVVSKDYIHLYIEYCPSQNLSNIVKLLKGRISKRDK
ncbi:transposase [Myroides odoratimimus]|nr:transposase [Myroides odoratimimus]MEC4053474.1 transposase [Myroides odoratimimus]